MRHILHFCLVAFSLTFESGLMSKHLESRCFYTVLKNLTSFLRHGSGSRALASMPLTHIIPCRVSNMYNTRNRVISLSFIQCVKRSRTGHIHEEPELCTRDFITTPFLFLLHVGVTYVNCLWFLCPN